MKKIFMGVALMSVAFMTACSNKGNQQEAAPAAEPAAEPVAEAPAFIRLNAPLVVTADKAASAIDLARQLIPVSLKDAGAMEYDMFQSETRPGWMLIYETWKDQASLDAHSATPHFTTIVPQMQALGELSIDALTPEAKGTTIRINCHVQAKDEASKAQIIAKAKELVAASLKDSGVIEYDILSSVTRPMELMIYETWKDQPSLDAHSASAHFTRLVPEIQGLAAGMSIETFLK